MDISAKRAPARERVLDAAQSVIRDGASRPSSNLAALCDEPRHAAGQLTEQGRKELGEAKPKKEQRKQEEPWEEKARQRVKRKEGGDGGPREVPCMPFPDSGGACSSRGEGVAGEPRQDEDVEMEIIDIDVIEMEMMEMEMMEIEMVEMVWI